MRRLFNGLKVVSSCVYHKQPEKYYLENYLSRLEAQLATYPRTEALEEMMDRMLTKEQAEFLTRVPRGPVFVSDMVKKMGGTLCEQEVRDMLDSLFSLGMLEEDNEFYFHFPEIYIGWFEFFYMRDRHGELPMDEISEYLLEYKRDFIKFNKEIPESIDIPKMMRVAVREEVLSPEKTVVDYESARRILESVDLIGVTECCCQNFITDVMDEKEAEKIMKKYPIKRCMFFGRKNGESMASGLIKHGLMEEITKEEAYGILDMAKKKGLVQSVDNSKNPMFLCNCPKGVCNTFRIMEQQRDVNENGNQDPVEFGYLAPSRYLGNIKDIDKCTGCGICANLCPAYCFSEIYVLDDDNDERKKKVSFDSDYCLGCGVCVSSCKYDALEMIDRPEDLDSYYVAMNVPEDTLQRGILTVTELGMVHALIFCDDDKLFHRMMIPIFRSFERSELGKKMFKNNRWFKEAMYWIAKKKIEMRLEKERY